MKAYKLVELVKLFALHIVCIAILFGIEFLVVDDSNTPENRLEYFETSGTIVLILSVIIIMPIIEECFFRLPLYKSKAAIVALILGIPFIILAVGQDSVGIFLAVAMTICNLFALYVYFFTKKKKLPL